MEMHKQRNKGEKLSYLPQLQQLYSICTVIIEEKIFKEL